MRSRSLVTIAVLVCASGVVLHHNQSSKYTATAYAAAQGRAVAGARYVYFSPGSNLEEVDADLIRQARSSITIAMYASFIKSSSEVQTCCGFFKASPRFSSV
jgi:hypothetical protein